LEELKSLKAIRHRFSQSQYSYQKNGDIIDHLYFLSATRVPSTKIIIKTIVLLLHKQTCLW
jgi:hypothetical protein